MLFWFRKKLITKYIKIIFFIFKKHDSTVTSTEITIASIDNGKEYMVTSGLKAGDRIVTEGVNTLKDGMTIKAAGSQNNQ